MADVRLGQQLGNYRLIRLLGQGSFADVYLGEHSYLKTLATIKILHMRLVRDDMQGFRTIASLKHPQIVRVLGFGVESATPFLLMDYAPLYASREALRNNDTMGKSMRKIEEKEGTYDSPNHFTSSRYSNPCRVAPPL